MSNQMECIVATGFGDPVNVLEKTTMDKPAFEVGKGKVLVRVSACSLSPGDWRMLSGDARLIKKPKKFPYVPGLDVCGIVEAIDPRDTKLKGSDEEVNVGDCVVGTWSLFGVGGFAEYALVERKNLALKPKNVTDIDGAALANSSSHAMQAFKMAKVKPKDRVMVLGGSGGVGTILLQLLKNSGVEFIASTSTDVALLTSLGVDRAIDYTVEDWTTIEEFTASPFDVVIDCAVGFAEWERCLPAKVLKPRADNGRWIAVVLKEWHISVKSIGDMFSLMAPPLWKELRSKFSNANQNPRYHMFLGGANSVSMSEVFKLVSDNKIRVVLDKESPYPFTVEGARDAFIKLAARKGHGKLVLEINSK